jgi:hypothetical protein
MTDDPKKKLEELKEKIRKNVRRYSKIDEELDALEDEDGRILGPRDDLEAQRRRRELKESEDE